MLCYVMLCYVMLCYVNSTGAVKLHCNYSNKRSLTTVSKLERIVRLRKFSSSMKGFLAKFRIVTHYYKVPFTRLLCML